MDNFQKFRKFKHELEKRGSNSRDEMDVIAFTLSLIPIPFLQQGFQILDRICSDEKLKRQLTDIGDKIFSINSKIQKIENDAEKIMGILQTLQSNESLQEELKDFSMSLIPSGLEWNLLTSKNSYQEVINSYIEALDANIIADDDSNNIIENTIIKSQKTTLRAHNQSSNYFNNTKFISGNGSVSMSGVSTTGKVELQGSSVRIFGNSSIRIGTNNPKEYRFQCPYCKNILAIDKDQASLPILARCYMCKGIFKLELDSKFNGD